MTELAPVRAAAPCRVDLAGGTLDLWPLSQLVQGAVTVNAAVDLLAECTYQPGGTTWRFRSEDAGLDHEMASLPPRPEAEAPPAVALAATCAAFFAIPPGTVTTRSGAPRGSGLGGSSALTVALVAALARVAGRELDDAAAVNLARDLETRILGMPAGTQDHWAARCGGVSVLRPTAGGTEREALPEAGALLDRALVLADTGVQHHSGLNNWSVFRAFFDGDGQTRAALAEVAAAAREMAGALAGAGADGRGLEAVGAALRREWAARRRLSPAVSCPEVERVVEAAESLGGSAKVCGAGGGGAVACLPSSLGTREALEHAVEATGARLLPARVREAGVLVAA